MYLYDKAFYFSVYFLAGVAIISFGLSFNALIFATSVFGVVLIGTSISKKNKYIFWLGALSLAIILGGLFYFYDDTRFSKNLSDSTSLSGVVISDPEKRFRQQSFIVQVAEPSMRILVHADEHVHVEYGDDVAISGKISPAVESKNARYLRKERISGTIFSPSELLVFRNESGVFSRKSLFQIKDYVLSVFESHLSPERAAFLGGILLGERAQFSDDFKNALSNSGTTHLVALSGYNISILIVAVVSLLGAFLRRRMLFLVAIFFITLFVVMTGADASVVRAAIMGGIALVAEYSGRTHSMRNAITISAFLMVLHNPRVLVFDVGFQLSFVALLGIVYIKPLLARLIKAGGAGRLNLTKENILTTSAAQIAVFPLIIFYFGQFPLLSIFANLLVLEFIPYTMFVGFIMAAASVLSSYLAALLGLVANLLLAYEIFIIKFFGGLRFLMIESASFSGLIALVYSATLISFVYVWHARVSKKHV